MGLFDKMKKVADGDAFEDDFDEEYYKNMESSFETEEPAPVQEAPAPAAASASASSAPSYAIPRSPSFSLSSSALEMKIVKPEHFDSASQIAEHLLSGRTVVLNLENTNKETARRLIDFLSGVAYSIDGSLKKAANNAYIITPNNVDVGDARVGNDDSRFASAPADAAPADDDFGGF